MSANDVHGNFSTAIQFWRGIELPALQKQLDQQGLSIVENQKDGLVSRKKLAEQTRGLFEPWHSPVSVLNPPHRIQKDIGRAEATANQGLAER